MKFILNFCLLGIFIQDLLQTLVKASTLCPQNFTYVANSCVYTGPKTDWFTAVQHCSLFESSGTLINMKESDLDLFTSFLLKKGVDSLWMEAKRNGPYEPIIYQLPSSPYYGNKLSDFKQTTDIWLQNEPSHEGDESCMVVTITNTTLRNELQAKMDRCNEPIHNYICITNPCGSGDKLCQQQQVSQNRRVQEIKSSIVPKMEIRKENNRYFLLDVYNPEKLWNFTNSTVQKIRNPVCMLEDGNMEVNITAQLDPKKILTWTFQNITEDEQLKKAFKYSITKQVFRIIIETEGYFVCQAFIADTMEKIKTEKTIYRTDLKRHIFIMSLVYNVPNCSLEICEPTYNVNADYEYLNLLWSKMKSVVTSDTDGLTSVLYIRSSKFCHKEETTGHQILHWRTTNIGEIVSPTELCIDKDGELCVQPSATSSYLFSLSEEKRKNRNATEILEKLQYTLARQNLKDDDTVTRFAKVDIQSVARTMFSLQSDGLHDSDIPLVANITDTIMKLASAEKDVRALRNVTPRFTLLTMDVSAAVFLPPQLISHLSSTLQTTDKGNSFIRNSRNSSFNHTFDDISKRQIHRLVINMFWDDGLFKSTNGTPLHVISVTVDGVKHQDLNPPLILLFDNSYANASSGGKDCVFWDFKASSGLGNWSDIGCTLAVRSNNSYSSSLKTDLCICTHLTHFGQLVSPSLEEEINLALDIITIFGCSASLLGLFGIGLTALVIPEWRRGASKKIQLHLSASLGILMIVFLINALIFETPEDRVESRLCLFVGVVLHFAVISTFCWMLVAAWFQYLRLTKPLASRHRTTHILLKSGIFAWGFPCIPCVILLTISPESYNSSQCYPTGMAHYISVIVPIAIIISLNVWMYVLIVCSIYNLGKFGAHINLEFQYANNPKYQKSLACRRLTTLVFLFFLLGLSWLFGIWKLSYLFCCTATLQGLAFFVFFVILEKNTRTKWVDLFMKKKDEPAYPLSNRSSLGSTLKRWSHISRGTSRRTVSTVSSMS
ncbi:hypothetical protein C0J52_18351 [Blattella germanica]|nr:hypothetical protein C0J52_18351 [Blattella germanica]